MKHMNSNKILLGTTEYDKVELNIRLSSENDRLQSDDRFTRFKFKIEWSRRWNSYMITLYRKNWIGYYYAVREHHIHPTFKKSVNTHFNPYSKVHYFNFNTFSKYDYDESIWNNTIKEKQTLTGTNERTGTNKTGIQFNKGRSIGEK